MRTLRRPRAPFWFVLLVTVAAAVTARSVCPAPYWAGAGLHDAPAPQLAFFGFLVAIAELAWKALEVAGRITLQVLAYSLGLLWKFVNLIADGAHELAGWTWAGLRKGWSLLRLTYSNVLKPAWSKVWNWIDRAERWLERTVGPVLKWLRRIRTWVLDFYARYVRPILDLMDITRRALRVLASLGFDWARTLDRKIADLEARIERPFRLLLAKVNEVINIVNRVVTADGLFQRLAHVRSIERDIREVSRAFANWRSVDVTDDEVSETQKRLDARSLDQVVRDGTDILVDNGGRYAALVDEAVQQGRKYLLGR